VLSASVVLIAESKVMNAEFWMLTAGSFELDAESLGFCVMS
jgi:hypothetical protein